MFRARFVILLRLVAIFTLAPSEIEGQEQPNIVLVFMDNFRLG